MLRQILASVGPFALVAGGLAGSTPTPSTGLGPTSFAPPGVFPTSVYKSYFNDPTATSAQPQPVISDPVLHSVYPFALTNPKDIPQNDTKDPHPLPPVVSSAQLAQAALTQIESLFTNPVFGNNTCASCQAILEVLKFVSLAAPEETPNLAVQLCDKLDLSSNCENQFGPLSLGSPLTQVLANADVGGYDGQAICWNFLGLCPMPPTSPLNLTGWFAKPKPNPLPPPKKPSGKLLKVLHLSDMHIDPRYATGAEANCSSGLCCRENAFNRASPQEPIFPAPRYGAYLCDTPYSLMLAAVQAIPVLTGTEKTGFDFGIYTGDLVSHDSENELSRDYVMYAETVLYDLLKRILGTGPFYVALGNHDTHNEAQDAPHSIGGALAEQFSWNYDHVTSLWQHEGWIDEATVQLARAHYAGYSVRRTDGLRIITLNTDFWYTANLFNYINLTTSDTSGMLRFLTDELQDAEDEGDRVWILGHVLSGWDGTNPLANPTNLFYQIVDRFSPHVIAGIFFGHTHEDQLEIFYANNGTVMNAETAQAVAWIAPSLTPLTNLNSGFRMYEVDSATFDIVNAYTWRADVNSFSELDNQTKSGPAYVLEYDTRETYGSTIGFGPHDPLNATWWHLVTEAMEANNSLVATFNTLQGKESALTAACTGDCIKARICYMRSGSASLAFANCIPGFGSVQ
ncbi:hypothetical protein CERSUDRAFT_161311 [Gelatoporia subvermispora B]|uniref:Sphingomyelin phosphodiesterase n=1 Tax=Ceriporiopsis subvermispora (strain B) TaxID=914234 RepID=M2Q7I3_CERS8|nr:hypothetical protein CERSUDRAFT_161311 [Gelatoporia subvermispora B]